MTTRPTVTMRPLSEVQTAIYGRPLPWWQENIKAQTDALVASYQSGALTPHQLLGALYAGLNP